MPEAKEVYAQRLEALVRGNVKLDDEIINHFLEDMRSKYAEFAIKRQSLARSEQTTKKLQAELLVMEGQLDQLANTIFHLDKDWVPEKEEKTNEQHGDNGRPEKGTGMAREGGQLGQ